MSSNILEYKGYFTKIEYSAEDKVLHGKIEGINDLINFESESIFEIEDEFHAAVDDYLEFCSEVGKEPDKVYKGTFNVRINPDLHRKASLLAFREGITLNRIVEKALDAYVNGANNDRKILNETILNLSYVLNRKASQIGHVSKPIAAFGMKVWKQQESATSNFPVGRRILV